MTGLEKIISKINSDGKERCDSAEAAAAAECDKIIAAAQESGKASAAAIIAAAEKESEQIIAVAKSGIAQQERRTLLTAKVEAVNETLAKLLSAMKNLPEKEYFAAIIKLAAGSAMKGECTALLGSADLARLPADFEARLCSALSEKGSACSLSKEATAIESGIVLVYGDIEVNCTFEAVIEANAEELKAQIGKMIF